MGYQWDSPLESQWDPLGAPEKALLVRALIIRIRLCVYVRIRLHIHIHSLQHAAVRSSHYQPTVSYAGQRWWQRLNGWELLHVEHHDFPRASPEALVQISQRFHPVYESLHQVRSIRQLIWSWLTLTDGSAWSDFAAHQYQSADPRH